MPIAGETKEPSEVKYATYLSRDSNKQMNRPTHAHTDPILTASEVAAELRCSKAHVYQLLNGSVEGLTILPHLALGRKKVIPRSAFERWKSDNLTGNIDDDSKVNDVDAALKGAMRA